MGRNALKLGRVLGIEIGLDFSWFVIFLLITWTLAAITFPGRYPGWEAGTYWLVGVATSLLLFASVLAHELGHSLVAIRTGTPVRAITLFIFGGVANLAREPERPAHEFWIALAGPAVSLALAGLFIGLSQWVRPATSPLSALAQWVGYVNLMLAVFNLIPGFPLDGGRVLRALLWGALGGRLRATRIASIVGRTIAYLFIIGGIGIIALGGYWLNGLWIIFIGWFLENAAANSYRQLLVQEVLAGHQVGELVEQGVPEVPRHLPLQQLVDEYVVRTGRRCFPVVEEGELFGVVTVHDINKVAAEARSVTTVAEVMTTRGETIRVGPHQPVQGLLEQMSGDGVNQVLVVDERRFLGLVTRAHLLDFIRTQLEVASVSR